MKTIRRTRAGSVMKRRTKQTIFYWSILALPLLQFGIFYVGVNFNSILLSFRDYSVTTAGGYSWVGFDNYIQSSVISGSWNICTLLFAILCCCVP